MFGKLQAVIFWVTGRQTVTVREMVAQSCAVHVQQSRGESLGSYSALVSMLPKEPKTKGNPSTGV